MSSESTGGPRAPAGARVVAVIAASSGGPRALARIFSELPASLPAAVLVVQHMPAGFTRKLAMRLDRGSPLPVAEAVDGESVLSGRVYIAPAGKHMYLAGEPGTAALSLDDSPPLWGVRPAADPLLESVARCFRQASIGVILTGMGRDGAAGMLALRRAGGKTIVQDRETAAVFGMPGATLDVAGADHVLSLDRIASAIQELAAAALASRPGDSRSILP